MEGTELMSGNDRVALTIQVGSTSHHTLITSRAAAEAFRDEWESIGDGGKIRVQGVIDDRDANEVELIVDREEIKWMTILEIKV